MRLAVGAAITCAALYLACGGVNMSDDQRIPARAAGYDDEELDDEDDAGSGGDEELEETTAPPPTVAPADAGTSSDADATAPVPPGSFAAGTELETTANLNLREGPGTDFAIVATMPEATRVKVQTTSGADGWVHLDYAGTLGYASKTFLAVP